nr:immunoglobulin heavy chain junction region [Mus musculus]MBK4196305.1 immunoglobulin heavy chain junction region [Mus musculus]MBK4196306.1 immunoglobulin heavy chain junction region [Mus musculus]
CARRYGSSRGMDYW